MKNPTEEERRAAWVRFYCAALILYGGDSGRAADKASASLQVYYDKTFNKVACKKCRGTGNVTRPMVGNRATGTFKCDDCRGTGEKS